MSLAPILLPIILIAGYTILKNYSGHFSPTFMQVAKTLGNKNIALAIATAIAMAMLVWQKRTSLKDLSASAQAALASGGVIILITAGGGAFGGMLQQTGVAHLFDNLEQSSPLILLGLAFLVTTGVRTSTRSPSALYR